MAAGHYNGLAVRVYGDKGALEWAQEDPEHLRYTPMDGATQLLARGTGCIREKAAAQGRLPSGHPEGLVTAFANIYRNYVSALVAKKNGADAEVYDYPRVEDGVNGVRFVKAVVESAANGSKWVEV